jgi:hypothetical protein
MSKQNFNPSYWCIWCSKNIKNGIKLKKLRPFKVEGVKNYINGNHNQKLVANVSHYGWWKCGHIA